jgi:hypothetical protein
MVTAVGLPQTALSTSSPVVSIQLAMILASHIEPIAYHEIIEVLGVL